jgi:hypothetical protein
MASTYKPRIDHSKKDYESEAADMAQDKKVVKKAFQMHDKQEHPGEKTDLSKLKKGGRAKMKTGSVRNFKAGGLIGVKSDDKQPNAKGAPKGAAQKYNKGGMC